MEIENMLAFVAVAELKSVSAAAASLNHLQSNMTAKIKKIESHYQRQLFLRSARGMELTPEGEKLYKQFKRIILLWEETEQEMQQRELKLRIGTMQSAVGTNIAEAFANLYRKYPALSVTLKTGTTETMENELLQGHIDLAYTIGKSDRAQLTYKPIGTEEMVLAGKNIGSSANLIQALQGKTQLILSKDCLYASILERICVANGIKQGPKTEVGVFETLLQLSSLGMGVTLISKTIARQFGVTDYFELPPGDRYIEKYLVTRQNYELSPLERQFVEISHFI
ncbi:LysR family transcriptional regulator [Paenibacillus cookii]|nr:LysR family transcriptional regulator [Paenibacillus cookii]